MQPGSCSSVPAPPRICSAPLPGGEAFVLQSLSLWERWPRRGRKGYLDAIALLDSPACHSSSHKESILCQDSEYSSASAPKYPLRLAFVRHLSQGERLWARAPSLFSATAPICSVPHESLHAFPTALSSSSALTVAVPSFLTAMPEPQPHGSYCSYIFCSYHSALLQRPRASARRLPYSRKDGRHRDPDQNPRHNPGRHQHRQIPEKRK